MGRTIRLPGGLRNQPKNKSYGGGSRVNVRSTGRPRRLQYTEGGEVGRRRRGGLEGTPREEMARKREHELEMASRSGAAQIATAGIQRGERIPGAEAAMGGAKKKPPYVRRGARVSRELVRDVRIPGKDKYITRAESAQLGQRQRTRDVAARRSTGRGGRIQYQEKEGGPRIDQKYVRGGRYYGYKGEEGAPSDKASEEFGQTLLKALGMGQGSRVRGAEKFRTGLIKQRQALAPPQPTAPAAQPAAAQPAAAPAPQPVAAAPTTTAQAAGGTTATTLIQPPWMGATQAGQPAPAPAAPLAAPPAPAAPTPAAQPTAVAQMDDGQLFTEVQRASAMLQQMEAMPGDPQAYQQAEYMGSYDQLLSHRSQLVAEQQRRQAAAQQAQQQTMAAIPTTPSAQLSPLPSDTARTWRTGRYEDLDRQIAAAGQDVQAEQSRMGRIPEIAAAEADRRYPVRLPPEGPAPVIPQTTVDPASLGIRGQARPGVGAEAQGFGPSTKMAPTPEEQLVQQQLDAQKPVIQQAGDQLVLNNIAGPDHYMGSAAPYMPGVGDNATKARVASRAIQTMLQTPPPGHDRASVARVIRAQTWYQNLPESMRRLEDLLKTTEGESWPDPGRDWRVRMFKAAIEAYGELYNIVEGIAAPAAPPPVAAPTRNVSRAVGTAANMPGFGG